MSTGRQTSTSIGVVALAIALLPGCSADPAPAAPVPPQPRPEHEPTSCAPLLDGEGSPALEWASRELLLVDERWLLDVATRRLAPLSWPLASPEADAGISRNAFALSPSGAKIAVADGDGLRTGPLRGQAGDAAPLPLLRAAVSPEIAAAVRTVVAFEGEDVVWVRRYEPYSGAVRQCDAYDARAAAWRELDDGCLEGELAETYRVISGPGGLAAIFAAGEGHPSIRFARLGPRGQAAMPTSPGLDLYPAAPLSVAFSTDSQAAWLATPCRFDRVGEVVHPCLDEAGDQLGETVAVPWRLFRWQVDTGRLELVADTLPPGSAPGPDGATIAWPAGRCVCLGDVAGNAAGCVPLPG
jgi:hypothetical protein